MRESNLGVGCVFLPIIIWVSTIIIGLVGWVNHLIVCFREAEWGFLIAGALFFPIGVIHGWGRIFGWW